MYTFWRKVAIERL